MGEYEKEKEILGRLRGRESVILVIAATMVGLLPMLILLGFLTSGIRLPILLFVVPGAIVGFLVRFIARPISVYLRLIPTLTVFLVMVAYAIIFLVTPTFYAIAVANIFVVLITSKRGLSKEEEKVIWLEERGKISL